MSGLTVPVAMIVFNRPETTRRVFASVAAARPERLFLIADGPRAGRAGEAERCEEVRRIMTAVDWPCEVKTNFAEKNMGCRRRVISGLDWVFEHVEEAIILEDDCLPDATFFPYCAELLERYRDSPQVAYISGFNPLEKEFSLSSSYYFSQVVNLWGWGTWRRSWRAMDEHIRSWPEVKALGVLSLIFPKARVARYWTSVFDRMHAGTGPSTWDYQFVYACWMRNGVGAFPARNLVQNIGFGADATHTTQQDSLVSARAGAMSFPLRHPAAVTAWPAHAMRMHEYLYAPSLAVRIWRKLCRVLGRAS
jgi:hypothetical protein